MFFLYFVTFYWIYFSILHEKGIDTIFRHTDEGRIYGATFIDHRTGCVFNGSRLGREFSANALQEHFTLPYENERPIPITVQQPSSADEQSQNIHYESGDMFDGSGSGLGLLNGSGSSSAEAQEAAFDKELRRKKKKRKGLKL